MLHCLPGETDLDYADAVIDPRHPPGIAEAAGALSSAWLPTGVHWDLNIRRDPQVTLGPFAATGAGGWKMIPHTTESERDTASIIADVLRAKRATAHFVFGYDPDTRFPVVIQCAPLNHAVLTLQHTFPPETNRARCIQIEICGRAANADHWSDNYLKGLANLSRMIERRIPIPRRAPVPFLESGAFRLRPEGFVHARGWFGHEHVPGNDHTDPGMIRIQRLFHFMETAANHGNELRPRTL